jgi:hypothetical protein
MNIICRHCDEAIVGNAYRVTSEADGVPLLNMIVCPSCAAVAESLLLRTEEIKVEQKTSCTQTVTRLICIPRFG